jgi:hypothetical protein
MQIRILSHEADRAEVAKGEILALSSRELHVALLVLPGLAGMMYLTGVNGLRFDSDAT